MWIARHILNLVHTYAGDFKIVAIVGPRQSGKTTLARHAFPDRPYVNLEELDQRRLGQCPGAEPAHGSAAQDLRGNEQIPAFDHRYVGSLGLHQFRRGPAHDRRPLHHRHHAGIHGRRQNTREGQTQGDQVDGYRHSAPGGRARFAQGTGNLDWEVMS